MVRGMLGVVAGSRLDHVGVEGALGQERGCVYAPIRRKACCLGFEDAHKAGADALAFHFRVGDASQIGQEILFGVDCHQMHPLVLLKGLHHLGRFTLTQQTMIHEHTGQALTHRALHQGGGHGAVHAAAETADHMARWRPPAGGFVPLLRG